MEVEQSLSINSSILFDVHPVLDTTFDLPTKMYLADLFEFPAELSRRASSDAQKLHLQSVGVDASLG